MSVKTGDEGDGVKGEVGRVELVALDVGDEAGVATEMVLPKRRGTLSTCELSLEDTRLCLRSPARPQPGLGRHR